MAQPLSCRCPRLHSGPGSRAIGKLVFLHSPKHRTIAAACGAIALLLVGCTINSSDERGDTPGSVQPGVVSDSLAPRLNSYAIQTTEEPSINAHFFGITGASSLSDAMEDDILTTFKKGGVPSTNIVHSTLYSPTQVSVGTLRSSSKTIVRIQVLTNCQVATVVRMLRTSREKGLIKSVAPRSRLR